MVNGWSCRQIPWSAMPNPGSGHSHHLRRPTVCASACGHSQCGSARCDTRWAHGMAWYVMIAGLMLRRLMFSQLQYISLQYFTFEHITSYYIIIIIRFNGWSYDYIWGDLEKVAGKQILKLPTSAPGHHHVHRHPGHHADVLEWGADAERDHQVRKPWCPPMLYNDCCWV